MSTESAKKFRQDLESNESLKSKFDDFMESTGKLSEKELKQKTVEFANKEGYDVEESDFKDTAFSGDSEELSEDELLNVSGGLDASTLLNDYIECGYNNLDCCLKYSRAELVKHLLKK